MNYIHPHTVDLIKAFLKREAMDFSSCKNSSERMLNFIKFRFDKIKTSVEMYEGEVDSLIINSYTNVGTLIAMIFVPLKRDRFEYGENITVNLCTCGNDSCWGNIILPNNKEIGELGVQPL